MKSKYIEKELDDALNKTKIHTLFKGSVFLTTILFNLKFKWNTEISTACTNGTRVEINPNFFMSLNVKERVFLYLHEGYHVAFLHMIRGRNKDHRKYNIAADHCINLMLKEQGYSVIKGALADSQYKEMSTDQIYDLLPDEPPSPDDDLDIEYTDDNGEALSDEAIEALENDIENLVLKAATASQKEGEKPGTIPNSILAELDRLINPVLDWKVLLNNYVTGHAKNDFSWRRPNRRLLNLAYLPSLYSEALTHISLAIDLSCSVTKEQYMAFLSEAQYIMELMNPELMSIVTFNTNIIDIFKMHEGDDILDLPFNNGGGTDISTTIDHYNKLNPTVVIVFSDLELDHPDNEPTFPVIWIKVGDSNWAIEPKSGDVIQYPVDV